MSKLNNNDKRNSSLHFIPIWFNAWEYENEASMIYPLLYAVRQAYQAQVLDKDKLQGVQKFAEKFIDVVATSTLVLSDVGLKVATKAFAGESIGFKELKDKLDFVRENQNELNRILGEWADNVSKLKKAFNDLLEIFASDYAEVHSMEKEKIRFAVLIDDLDRCLPDTTIKVLESIKNHLAVKNVVFLLALNPRVVYQGIRIKYNNLDINGREYLEKILNYTFYVPEPDSEKIFSFASKRIRLLLGDENVKELDSYFTGFGQVLRDCNFNNPRKVKRILNRYLLFLNKYSEQLERYPLPNIVRLLIIAEYYPDLFQLFLNSTDDAKNKSKFGEQNFSISEFENEFGISISGIYSQLSRARELFKFVESKDINRPKLVQQAEAVFSITRLS